MTLPDGTKAWLNALSSIQYPAAFDGKERAVKVTGEVYLEVSPDKKKPFIVRSEGQRIEVLGTAFNVRNYNGRLRPWCKGRSRYRRVQTLNRMC